MDVRQTLIALSVTTVLATSMPGSAFAKQTDEDDSVHRWGRWAVLAPAAGVEETLMFPVAANELGRCEAGANCPEPQNGDDPQPPPPPPPPEVKSPCEAGMPCGFARVDRGGSESNNDYVAAFALDMQEPGGEDEEPGTVAFGVGAGTLLDPNTTGETTSDTEEAAYGSDLVRTLDRRAESILRGDILRDESDTKQVVNGFWQHGENTGDFVWGITATADEMNRLASELGGDTLAVYQGFTMNGGTVDMQVNFDAASWSGEFNGAIDFSASGDVVGSGFVSDANGFSENIAKGAVKGGFVNAGQNVIGGYEVVDTEGMKDADVFKGDLQPRIEAAGLK